MKKYRVVKAYEFGHMRRAVGDVIEIKHDGVISLAVDSTALSLGALEEVKAWEPKEGELVYYTKLTKEFSGRPGHYEHQFDSVELASGLIYPTREQAEECRKRMLEVARKYKEEVLG